MSFRFRRSLKIAPGFRLNVGMRSTSLSFGGRGATISVGARGTFSNVGLPGTGISFRQRLDTPGSPRSAAATTRDVHAVLRIDAGGKVNLTDSAGEPLPPRTERAIRTQNQDALQQALLEHCERWNQGIEHILGIHLQTPAPDAIPQFEPKPFDEDAPLRPTPSRVDLLARLIPSRRKSIERENAEAMQQHSKLMLEWEARREQHGLQEQERLALFEHALSGHADAMMVRLEEVFTVITWPRETAVAFDLSPDGRSAAIDVDLPEIEDLPADRAEVAARGLKINVRPRSDVQKRREYLTHIHGVLFRIIGEALAALPTLERVCASGYSQRPNPATAQVEDQYLLSLRADRARWKELDFANLAAIDLPACFERFELRRHMTKTGMLKAIVPFEFEELSSG